MSIYHYLVTVVLSLPFVVSQRTGSCQSKHPISGRSKQVPPYLPQGWSQSVDACGRTIYTNMITGRISYMDPRLAMASRLSASVNTATSHKTRFDKFTTADEVSWRYQRKSAV
ncbi:hypothetical protein AHF37_02972 [Paragonimus kellicotti]|nr:hypothetical protein AHF37_02972 [Paragonimus kellicotti]